MSCLSEPKEILAVNKQNQQHWLFAIVSISEYLRQSLFFVCGHASTMQGPVCRRAMHLCGLEGGRGSQSVVTEVFFSCLELLQEVCVKQGMAAHEEKALSQIFRNGRNRKQPMLDFSGAMHLLGFEGGRRSQSVATRDACCVHLNCCRRFA